MHSKTFISVSAASILLAGCVGAKLAWQYENDLPDGLAFLHTDSDQQEIYYIQDAPDEAAVLTILNIEGELVDSYALPDLVDPYENFELNDYAPYSMYIPSFDFHRLSDGAFFVYETDYRDITGYYFHSPKTGVTWDSVEGLESFTIRYIHNRDDGLLRYRGTDANGDDATALVDYEGRLVAIEVDGAEGAQSGAAVVQGDCPWYESARDNEGNRYSWVGGALRMCGSDGVMVWEKEFDYAKYEIGVYQDIGVRGDVFRINSRDELEISRTITSAGISGIEGDASLDEIFSSDGVAWSLTASQTINVVHQRFNADGVELSKVEETPNERVYKLPPNVGEWWSLYLSVGNPETTGACRVHDSLTFDNGDAVYATRYCNVAEGYGVNKLSFYSK